MLLGVVAVGGSDIFDALVNLDEDRVLSLVRKKLEAGEDPYLILEECRKAMTVVGEKFEKESTSSTSW